MKKHLAIFALLGLITALSCCTKTQQDTVILCDIKDISLDTSIFDITIEDLNSALSIRLSSLNSDFCIDKITDEQAQEFFGLESVRALKENTIYEIVAHRFSEACFNEMLAKSHVKIDNNAELFVSDIEEKNKDSALTANMSFDDYLKEYYGLSADDFRSFLFDSYSNMKIVFAFAENFDLSVSPEDIDKERQLLENEGLHTTDDDKYEQDYIKYAILTQKVQNFFIDYYMSEINNICNNLSASLID